ncbi:MAG: type I glyceraldehyde-3-phosphate dehydrogenase [Patescibacteria group bacterium]|nr:type I glyceraldehyde-3-phosphate dehydrogenase [Patescibacteria group bacterium]
MKKNTPAIRVAINGFGRVGRAAFKIILDRPDMEVVAINDLTDNQTLAHLLRYDSVYGIYNRNVTADEKNIFVDDQKIPCLAIKEPKELPWKKYNVDVVLECTGRFVKDGASKAHLDAGAKKVILSAPSKGKPEAPTYLMGVNHLKYKGENIISNASCTTNCIAPVTKIIDEIFGIKRAFLNTVHSYTADQNLVDGPHKDLRRARSAAANIVPTTTGAAISVTKVLPRLQDKFDGVSLRVPTICGSISDLTFLVRRKATVREINSALSKASRSKELKGVLTVSNEPLVSTDIIGNPASAIVDLPSTMVIGGDYVKILAWYDNEWGYSERLVDMVNVVMK